MRGALCVLRHVEHGKDDQRDSANDPRTCECEGLSTTSYLLNTEEFTSDESGDDQHQPRYSHHCKTT